MSRSSLFVAQVVVLGLFAIVSSMAQELPPAHATGSFHGVQCEGTYSKHLQGICTDDKDSIFWCFTDALVKTDAAGRVITKVPVVSHHGDLCHHDGKIYVAVNLGEFNQPAGKADSWVYVYAAKDLAELARHKIPEVVHGAGGIAFRDGRSFVVGGLPPGVEENYAYEYDSDFRFVERHVISSGYTLMGIQTAAYAGGYWWFGCYGMPKMLLKTDGSFRLVGKYPFDCALGIVGLMDGSFLVAQGVALPGKKYAARLVVADAHPIAGLAVREKQ